MFRFVKSLALCALIGVPLVASASPVVRVGDAVSVGAIEVVNGDWYAAGGTVTVSGPVKGDAYLAGGTITINAPIAQDIVVGGGTVRIHAAIGDDARIAAGDTTIAGTVAGDLIVMGGTVHIMDTAIISGDVLIYGGTVTIDGWVKGSLFGSAGDVKLNGKIDGPVTFAEVGILTLGSAANLRNGLAYTASHEAVQETGSRVTGEIAFSETALPGIDLWGMSEMVLMLGVLAFAFHYMFHKHLDAFTSRVRMRWGMTVLVGAGMMLATPMLAIISAATGVGFFLGVALGALFILMMLVALGFLCVLVGSYAMRLHTRTLRTTAITTLLGVLIVGVLFLVLPSYIIPFVLAFPLGALTLEIYSALFGKIRGR